MGVKAPPFAYLYACKLSIYCENSSVGRAQPCQGWGRGFESRFSLGARMVKLVDTQDLKSCGPEGPCGFKSRSWYPYLGRVGGILFVKKGGVEEGCGRAKRSAVSGQKKLSKQEKAMGVNIAKKIGLFCACMLSVAAQEDVRVEVGSQQVPLNATFTLTLVSKQGNSFARLFSRAERLHQAGSFFLQHNFYYPRAY